MNTPNNLDEQLSRLIIENQSEDGSIDISDQRAMKDEILELIQAYTDKAVKEARIEELERLNVPEWELESYGNAIEDRIAQLNTTKE